MADVTDILGVPPQPTTAAQAPAPAPEPAVIVLAEQSAPNNNRRSPDKNDRGVQFRSALSAAMFDGLAQAVSTDAPQDLPEQAQSFMRTVKTARAEPPVLSASESADLYQAAQTRNWSSPMASAHRAAATTYAKSYFSVERTYARPGEAVEIKA